MTKDLLKQIARQHDADPVDIILDYVRGLQAENGRYEEMLRAGQAEPRYVTFEAEHVEENPGDDSVVKHFIDGYPADEDGTGTVIAVVSLTKHGDIVVDWHHNGYRMHETVMELIDEIKAELDKIRKNSFYGKGNNA